MDKGGQLSADFLFAFLILLIIISAIIGIVSSGIGTANNAQLAEAKAIGENIAESINSVYTNGQGHYLIVKLPGDISYNLMVNNPTINSSATVAVQYNNKTAVSYLIPKSSEVDEVTMKPNETYKIYNDNGVIKFNKL